MTVHDQAEIAFTIAGIRIQARYATTRPSIVSQNLSFFGIFNALRLIRNKNGCGK
jgi:hypothetical protein